MSIDFKADEFDFDKEFEKVKNEIAKPNILICGATGVGKSSLVNDIFGLNLASVGEGRPITRGINLYEGESINLYDSEGYEIGEEMQKYYYDSIIGCIDKYKKDFPSDLNKHIHIVWYCISAANKRITETDKNIISAISKKNVPVAIVFTQIDSVDEEELYDLIRISKTDLKGIPYFTYCVTDDKEIKNTISNLIQKEELISWSIKSLPEILHEGFISALVGCIDEKKKYISSKVIPTYVVSAGATALIPIPFSDAAVLTPIQFTMCTQILNIYGLSKLKGGIVLVLERQIVAQVGKALAAMLAGNIAKFLPILDPLAGAVNATVASGITYAIGRGISELCYNYSKAILEGKDINISDFFNDNAIYDMFEKMAKEKK